MPVITVDIQDPTDSLVEGEQMRAAAIAAPAAAWWPIVDDIPDVMPNSLTALVADDLNYGMALDGLTQLVIRSKVDGNLVSVNSCISTPCGALVSFEANECRFTIFTQATNIWTMAGVTRNQSGDALGSCRVVVLETGQVAVGGAPVVGETTSDGSGNYSLVVPQNTAYQVLAYKPGSPDVAGVTIDTVTPTG
jgi:hypothetical protein